MKYKPSSGEVGSIRIDYLDSDQMQEYRTNREIRKLRQQNKIAVSGFGNELWAWKSDKQAIKKVKNLLR